MNHRYGHMMRQKTKMRIQNAGVSMKRILPLFLILSALLAPLSSLAGDTKPQAMEIERGRWTTEDANFPHRKTFRLLCVAGMEFLSMEGYGGGQSTTTAVSIIQVLDKNGKPKECK